MLFLLNSIAISRIVWIDKKNKEVCWAKVPSDGSSYWQYITSPKCQKKYIKIEFCDINLKGDQVYEQTIVTHKFNQSKLIMEN